MALPGNTDHEKLAELCSRNYKEQAVWFLNAFWDNFESEAENCWKYVHLYGELDLERKNDGNGLDELNAHRFLEKNNETLTVSELRNKLRSSGAIGQTERPKTVPITHYLLFKYQVDWKVLVNTCGDNSAEIAEAQRLLDEVSAAFEVARSKAEVARQKEAEARRQEAPFKAAQEELEAAVAALQAEEDAYNSKKDELTRKGEGSGVSAMKAKNELAQLLAEDPLPLRRAKITQEAALKKAEALRAPFEKATKEAEAARAAADAALDDASAKVAEAEAYLEEVKAKPGSPHGAIWWMERELHEAKAYLPTSKGGYKKN